MDQRKAIKKWWWIKSKLEDKVKIEYNTLDKTVSIYEANVFNFNNKFYTTGGRVMTITSCSTTLEQALDNIYNNSRAYAKR